MIDIKNKACSKCGREYPATTQYFYKHKRQKTGLSSWCKNCDAEYSKQYYRDNKVKVSDHNKEWRRKRKGYLTAYDRQRKYGLSVEEYDQLFQQQKGCCAICGRSQLELKRNLHVDHNHRTGEVRGLLCFRCNAGVGYLDDKKWLEKSVKYIANK